VEILPPQATDVTATDIAGNTALQYAASEGHADVVLVLLDRHANVNQRCSSGTALHQGAINGHIDVVAALLSKDADIEITDENQRTPLHVAAWAGQKEMVFELLSRGADIYAKDKENCNVLHLASSGGHTQLITMLLQRIELQNRMVFMNSPDKSGQTPLHHATSGGHKDGVSVLLNEGANIEARENTGKTALHFSVFMGRQEVVRLLLQHRANPKSRANDGWTATQRAVRRWTSKGDGRDNVVALLRAEGSKQFPSSTAECESSSYRPPPDTTDNDSLITDVELFRTLYSLYPAEDSYRKLLEEAISLSGSGSGNPGTPGALFS
jgi:ankyrin repeat protein